MEGRNMEKQRTCTAVLLTFVPTLFAIIVYGVLLLAGRLIAGDGAAVMMFAESAAGVAGVGSFVGIGYATLRRSLNFT